MPRLPLADMEMYYESRGSGPPLLLLPGMDQPVADVQPLIESLAPHFQVIAMDHRGNGRSSAPRGRYTIEQMAGDVLALMDRLGIDRAHLLGMSMGGRIGLILALHHPERVDRLALVSTSARVTGWRLKLLLVLLAAQLPGLRKPGTQPLHAMLAQFRANRSFDCTGQLGRITQPALVVHGRADVLVPLELGEEMHRGIPRAELLLLDAGHRLILDPGSHEVACAAVRDFLTSPVSPPESR